MPEGEPMTSAVIGTEPMNPADAAWLHMDRPDNFMVVNTLLWFDRPVDQAMVMASAPGPGDRALPPVPAAGRRPAGHAGALGRARVGRRSGLRPGRARDRRRGCPLRATRPPCSRSPASWPTARCARTGRSGSCTCCDGYGAGSALLLRTHHAIADGVALMQVLLAMTDPLDGAGERGPHAKRSRSATTPALSSGARRGRACRAPGGGGQAGAERRSPETSAPRCGPS